MGRVTDIFFQNQESAPRRNTTPKAQPDNGGQQQLLWLYLDLHRDSRLDGEWHPNLLVYLERLVGRLKACHDSEVNSVGKIIKGIEFASNPHFECRARRKRARRRALPRPMKDRATFNSLSIRLERPRLCKQQV